MITIEELSESLKTYLQGLGLTEVQVNSIVDGKIDELVGMAPESLNTFQELASALNNNPSFATDIVGSIGDLSTLPTTDKSSLSAAISEVFQSGNNAKQGLVDALVAKGVGASTSENWDVLNGKVSDLSSARLGNDLNSQTALVSKFLVGTSNSHSSWTDLLEYEMPLSGKISIQGLYDTAIQGFEAQINVEFIVNDNIVKKIENQRLDTTGAIWDSKNLSFETNVVKGDVVKMRFKKVSGHVDYPVGCYAVMIKADVIF